MKRFLSLLLIGAMMTSLFAGCGRKDPDAATKSEESKQYVYKMTELVELESGDTFSGMSITADRVYIKIINYGYGDYFPIYAKTSDYDTEYLTTTKIISVKFDGSDKKEMFCPSDESEYFENGGSSVYYGQFTADNDGNLYFVRNAYSYSYEGENMENYSYESDCSLIKFDAQGNELASVDFPEENSINTLLALQDGSIIGASYNSITIFDQNLKEIRSLDLSSSNFEANSMTRMKDGRLLIFGYDTNNWNTLYYTMDIATGELEQQTITKSNIYTAYPGYNHDLLYVGTNGIYGYDFATGESVQVMDYTDSDVNVNWFSTLAEVSDTQIIGSFVDTTDYTNRIALFTKVPPEQVQDRTIITLGCLYTSTEILKQVVAFNESNDEYRIRVKCYDEYNTADDYTLGITQLNNDIVSGNAPDIIVYSEEIPYESYVAKGLFADLGSYLDKDDTINRDDYVSNVFDACTSNGKLYMIVPSYSVSTLVGKESIFGSIEKWDAAAMMEVARKYPDATLIGSVDRGTMVSVLATYCIDDFVDWDTGKCSFTSQEFKDFLNLLAMFPEEAGNMIDYDDPNWWEKYDSQWREDRTLLNELWLSNFMSYRDTEVSVFGEPFTFVGFPSSDNNGHIFSPSLGLSVTSGSYYKDGCWEFIKTFLGEEYQMAITSSESYYTYRFPALKAAYEPLFENAMSKPYYLDENGEKIYYDRTTYIGDVEITLEPLTQEECDKIYNFVTSVTRIASPDEQIATIISENAAAYWAGQKTIEDVCNVIQSKISLYVSESM